MKMGCEEVGTEKMMHTGLLRGAAGVLPGMQACMHHRQIYVCTSASLLRSSFHAHLGTYNLWGQSCFPYILPFHHPAHPLCDLLVHQYEWEQ